MSKYVIEDTTLTAIGDAIRSKDGTTEPILVSDFASKIAAITTGGGSGGGEPSLNMRVTTVYSNASASNLTQDFTYTTQEDELGIYVMTIHGSESASKPSSSLSFTLHFGAVLITPTQFYNLTEGSGDNKDPFYRGVSIARTDTSFTVTSTGWSNGTKATYTPQVTVYALLK